MSNAINSTTVHADNTVILESLFCAEQELASTQLPPIPCSCRRGTQMTISYFPPLQMKEGDIIHYHVENVARPKRPRYSMWHILCSLNLMLQPIVTVVLAAHSALSPPLIGAQVTVAIFLGTLLSSYAERDM